MGQVGLVLNALKMGLFFIMDIPQERREVLEGLVRNQDVKLVICTSTLAEGVNLPI
jgi:superfamily II helicase